MIREIKESDIEERLEMLRQRHARMVPVDEFRAVQNGDHLVVDIEAVHDGEVITSLTVKDYHLEMGRDFYLPDFDSKLIGLKIGELNTILYSLSEDFPRKELAGKSATFSITIKEAKERIIPELSDELAKEAGPYETLDDLKKQIKEDLCLGYDMDIKEELRKQIVEKIIEANPFEAPESLVEARIDDIVMGARQNLARQGVDMKRFPLPDKAQRDSIKPKALDQVKAALIIKAIGEKEEIQASTEDIDTEIEKRAKLLGWTSDFLKDQLEENQRMQDFADSLTEDKIYSFIEEQGAITEVPYSDKNADTAQ